MCGIFYYKGLGLKTSEIETWFMRTQHRGPDNSRQIQIEDRFFGFHRLRIVGLSEAGDQPFRMGNCVLVCNGEIYNHRELAAEHGFPETTGSDCEVIVHMYKKFGPEFSHMLTGVFAFVLYDEETQKVMVSRDPLGIRALYWVPGKSGDDDEQVITSEMKSIPSHLKAVQFPPGHFYYDGVMKKHWVHDYKLNLNCDEATAIADIRDLLMKEVDLRLMSDRKIGCILSGGLDSTLVSAIVAKKVPNLHTYTIGLPGATDLHYARMASKHLGTIHHEKIVTEQEFMSAIPETIYQVESWDTTTIRASVGNYLVAKFIRTCNNGDVVIYCGDVADEILGSYRGFTKAPNAEEFQKENVKMLENIQYFDVLRSDKSISGAGLEARVPFGGKHLVDYIMTMNPEFKAFDKDRIEKYVLRQAFKDMLPEDLIWRRKEAFSDGVSTIERSWFEIIQEHTEKLYTDEEFATRARKYKYCTPYDKESLWYREIFEKFYPGRAESIPYYWKHPFTTEQDPSARKLDCY
jgi:asparagine synthase (glutamine-hydrolysing)